MMQKKNYLIQGIGQVTEQDKTGGGTAFTAEDAGKGSDTAPASK